MQFLLLFQRNSTKHWQQNTLTFHRQQHTKQKETILRTHLLICFIHFPCMVWLKNWFTTSQHFDISLIHCCEQTKVLVIVVMYVFVHLQYSNLIIYKTQMFHCLITSCTAQSTFRTVKWRKTETRGETQKKTTYQQTSMVKNRKNRFRSFNRTKLNRTACLHCALCTRMWYSINATAPFQWRKLLQSTDIIQFSCKHTNKWNFRNRWQTIFEKKKWEYGNWHTHCALMKNTCDGIWLPYFVMVWKKESAGVIVCICYLWTILHTNYTPFSLLSYTFIQLHNCAKHDFMLSFEFSFEMKLFVDGSQMVNRNATDSSKKQLTFILV